MPPRYAYWTILIDGKATAFRARDREELMPTFNQLARKNADIAMRYFARGRLWDSPEQAQWASRNPPDTRMREQRGRDWRPGGEHQDPRARFTKPKERRPRPQSGDDQRPAREFRKPDAERRPERRGFDRKVGKPTLERKFGKPKFERKFGPRADREGGKPKFEDRFSQPKRQFDKPGPPRDSRDTTPPDKFQRRRPFGRPPRKPR